MEGTTPRHRRLLMLLAGLFGLVTTVASALPGGMAGVSPESSATASGLAGQECASHAGRHCDQQRAAQRSEALRAGAAFYHRYYAAVLSRHQARTGSDATVGPEVSAVRAAVSGPVTASAARAGRPVPPPRDHRPPPGPGTGTTDPVRGPPSSTDL
ncbi:hypothetical protein [Actinomadura gamaensis]|uniref:Secreted protein n=1 Tax=Actinomadura gamaensis TaxID=1763541 RepID=A0ABV9UE83_9ACTN